jgi:peroxiredoxin/outer membrane lipoprotein-sorting protein
MPGAAPLLLFAALLLCPGPARAQGAPSAQDILSGVARAYSTLQSGWFDGRVTMEAQTRTSGTQRLEMPLTQAFQAPGKFLFDLRHEMMGRRAVCDGKQVLQYAPRFSQYTRHDLSPAETTSAAQFELPAMAFRDPFANLRGIAARLHGARLSREDSLQLGAAKVPCWVVEFDSCTGGPAPSGHDGGGALWIEKDRHLVLRSLYVLEGDTTAGSAFIQMRLTFDTDMARVDQPLPDSLFVFVAPPDAHEVEQFGQQRPKQVDLSGKPMIDFALKDLAGRTRKLSEFKGKVVLVDFWATWCGPCRIEMPNIQKLYRKHRAKGLVVLAVNVREEPATVTGFLKKNQYTFPVLLDAEGAVAQQYGASSIPTLVVIDRKGMISDHFVGVRSEEDLRAALTKAGL